MTSTIEHHMTVAEAAETLHVAQSTIRRWIREGRLPAYRIGQRRVAIREQDIARMIEPVQVGKDQDDIAIEMDEMATTSDGATTRGETTIGRTWKESAMSDEEIEAIRNRRLTPEEKRQALEALKRASENAARLTAKYGSNWTPSTLELIHEGREERTRQLMNDCD